MVGGDRMGNVEESGKYPFSDIAVCVQKRTRGAGGNSYVKTGCKKISAKWKAI